jgi:hypothetical protein
VNLLAHLPSTPSRVGVAGAASASLAASLAAAGFAVTVAPPLSPSDGVDTMSLAARLPLGDGAEVAALVARVHARLNTIWLFADLWDRLAPRGVACLLVDGDLLPVQIRSLCDLGRRSGFAVEVAAPELVIARKLEAPSRRLRMLSPSDLPDVTALFARVFERPRPPARLFEWKYGTGGSASIVARDRDGALVGHYGWIKRRLECVGRPLYGLQIADVMVEASARNGRVLFELGAATQEVVVGWHRGAGAIQLGYGFPNERHMRVGERLRLYAEVDALTSLRWSPSHQPPRARPATVEDAALVDGLWQLMRADLAARCVGVRDFAYLRHRYFEHPEKKYSVLIAGDPRAPSGLAVLARDGDACEILDVVAPLAALPVVIEEARREAGRLGAGEVFLWITRSQLGAFDGTGGREVPLDVRVPINVFTDPSPVEPGEVRHRWWLMGGDTDFH